METVRPNRQATQPLLLTSEPSFDIALRAFTAVHTEAWTNWLTLWEEMWMRAVSAKNPVDYAAAGFLMLPAYTSQALLYCKRLSEIAAMTGKPTPGMALSTDDEATIAKPK